MQAKWVKLDLKCSNVLIVLHQILRLYLGIVSVYIHSTSESIIKVEKVYFHR